MQYILVVFLFYARPLVCFLYLWLVSVLHLHLFVWFLDSTYIAWVISGKKKKAWHECIPQTCLSPRSVQLNHSVVSNSLQPYEWQHMRLPCPSPTLGACSNSRLSSPCYPTISSSVVPLSSCLQSFPASGYFLMSQFFTSGGQILESIAK